MARSRCRRTSLRSRGLAPAAPSSPAYGTSGRKLRPALPSHCVACGTALASFARVAPPGRLTITVTEVTSPLVDTHSAGPAAVSMRTSRMAAEAPVGKASSTVSAAVSRGRRRRIRTGYDTGTGVPARTIQPDAARSRDRTRGWTARRLGWRVRARPVAQARALADRGHSRRSDAESRPRTARPPRQRALLPALRRAVRAERAGALPRAYLGTCYGRGHRTWREGRARARPPAPPGRPRPRGLERARDRREGSGRRLLPAEGEPLGPPHRAAQPARPRHRSARAEHARLAPRDLTRLRLLRRSRDRRGARQRAAGGPRTAGAAGLAPRAYRARQEPGPGTGDQLAATSGQALHDRARRLLPAAGDRA